MNINRQALPLPAREAATHRADHGLVARGRFVLDEVVGLGVLGRLDNGFVSGTVAQSKGDVLLDGRYQPQRLCDDGRTDPQNHPLLSAVQRCEGHAIASLQPLFQRGGALCR